MIEKREQLLCLESEYTAYRVSQKKCDLRRLVQNCTFLGNSPAWCFFNILKKFYLFLVLHEPKENPQIFFFSQNQKFRKAKMCIHVISL